MEFTIDTRGFKEVEERMKKIMPYARGKKGYPKNVLRSAVRAGAKLIMEDAKRRAPEDPRTKSSLKEAIQLALISTAERDAAIRNNDSIEGYLIGYRSKKSVSKAYSPYGGWVELGTDRMPAQPYLRPALVSTGAAATAELKRKMTMDLDRIVKKLAKEGIQVAGE